MIVVEKLMAQDLEYGVGTTSKTHASGGTLNGHQISLSSFAVGGPSGSATTQAWDPDEVASGGSVSTTVSVPGAALGDFVLASYSLDLQGLSLSAYVSSSNTVTILIYNLSGASVDLGSGAIRVLVFRTR